MTKLIMTNPIHIREAAYEEIDAITQFQLAMAMETEHISLDPLHARAGVAGVFEEPHRGRYFVATTEGFDQSASRNETLKNFFGVEVSTSAVKYSPS